MVPLIGTGSQEEELVGRHKGKTMGLAPGLVVGASMPGLSSSITGK